jgi:hypothetical protein
LDDWEEEVEYRTGKDPNEIKSINRCKKRYYTDYKYKVFYEVGKDYTFDNPNLINNNYYAVSNLFYKI